MSTPLTTTSRLAMQWDFCTGRLHQESDKIKKVQQRKQFSKTMSKYETREEKRKEIKKDENYIFYRY